MDWLPPRPTLTGGQTINPGVRPDMESSLQPSCLRDVASTN